MGSRSGKWKWEIEGAVAAGLGEGRGARGESPEGTFSALCACLDWLGCCVKSNRWNRQVRAPQKEVWFDLIRPQVCVGGPGR